MDNYARLVIDTLAAPFSAQARQTLRAVYDQQPVLQPGEDGMALAQVCCALLMRANFMGVAAPMQVRSEVENAALEVRPLHIRFGRVGLTLFAFEQAAYHRQPALMAHPETKRRRARRARRRRR